MWLSGALRADAMLGAAAAAATLPLDAARGAVTTAVGRRTGAHGRRPPAPAAGGGLAPAAAEAALLAAHARAAACDAAGLKLPLALSCERSDCVGSTAYDQPPLGVRTAGGGAAAGHTRVDEQCAVQSARASGRPRTALRRARVRIRPRAARPRGEQPVHPCVVPWFRLSKPAVIQPGTGTESVPPRRLSARRSRGA